MTRETIGDYGSSTCLFAAYQGAMMYAMELELKREKKIVEEFCGLSNFKEKGEAGWDLLDEFDKACQTAFENTICDWNDYNQAIIELSVID
eukprot:scaffold48787_cov89-Cyclotella_meneghiniana.AAC.5